MPINRVAILVSIIDKNWETELKDIDNISQTVASAALSYLHKHNSNPIMAEMIKWEKPFMIGISLSNDKEVQKLNKEYRGKNKPTNVLSFANIDSKDALDEAEIFNEIELGDIIIALETTKAEAKTANISLKDHFSHLIAHGILHLAGYDHMNDKDADQMESMEVEILKQLNIKNPYEEA